MIEEVIEYHNLKKVQHTLICPDCRISLTTDNIVLTTYPAKYPYHCPNCGYYTTAYKIYPYTEIVGDPICTYQQEVE